VFVDTSCFKSRCFKSGAAPKILPEIFAMPIRPHLSGAAFGPEVITTMSSALEEACRRLEAEPRPGLMKETIAGRIIELVRQGERDPKKLSAGALADTGMSPVSDGPPQPTVV
jgi:hypothetical protein